MPHARDALQNPIGEVVGLLEDVVSPEGIDLVQSSAKREDARLIPPGEP